MPRVETTMDVGDHPRVIGSGTNTTTVALDASTLTLRGSVRERRELVRELGLELGLVVNLPGVAELTVVEA